MLASIGATGSIGSSLARDLIALGLQRQVLFDQIRLASTMDIRNFRRVLVYRLGSLGDILVSLPAFHLVRDAFPEARVTLLTNSPPGSGPIPAASILEGTGLVDDYLEYPTSLRNPRGILALRRTIARRGFDGLIYLAEPRGGALTSLRDALFFLGCGIVRQIGVPLRRRDLRSPRIPGTGRHAHESERLIRCIRRLGQPDLEGDRWWDLHLSDREDQEARGLLGPMVGGPPFLALCAGAKADAKDWTEPNWSALIRRLDRDSPGLGMVAVGTWDDAERSDRVLAGWSGPKRNLCGASAPRVSAAILRYAALFLGHDSGPMHLASCVGTPCVAVFSAHNLPGVWYPRGRGHSVIYHQTECFGCLLTSCAIHHKKCIMSITVEEVYQAVMGQIARLSVCDPQANRP